MSPNSRSPHRHRRGRAAAVALITSLWACGGSDLVEPEPELSALVGDWEAVELRISSTLAPTVSVELIETGASFTLNIQPSGQYTAILFVSGQDQTELGQVQVNGSEITLVPSVPPGQPTTTGTFSVGDGLLVVDGATEFDFNLDGSTEPAQVHMELQRR